MLMLWAALKRKKDEKVLSYSRKETLTVGVDEK